MVHLGWEEQKLVYGCVIHVDIKDGKIWIQRDRTETGIANELVAVGVPKEDIVLAFKAPYSVFQIYEVQIQQVKTAQAVFHS